MGQELYIYSVLKLSFLLVWLCLGTLLRSQTPTNDTLEISGIEVIARPADTDTSEHVFQIRMEGSGSLSEVIHKLSYLNIKTYGPGAVSTLSYRGSPPAHSVIRWNGVSLNSPFLGQADLSQIPAGLGNVLTIQDAQRLDGGAGASLNLQSEPLQGKENQLQLKLSTGSFGKKEVVGKAAWSNEKTGYSIQPYFQLSPNRYPYRALDRSGAEVTRYREFAAYSQRGLIQQISQTFQRNQILSLHSWIQNSERDLPPPSGSSVQKRNESLEESASAHLLRYQSRQASLHIEAAVGYQQQSYLYHFHPADALTRTDFSGISNLLNAAYPILKNTKGETHWEGKYQEVASDNYASLVQRKEGILFQQFILQLTERILLEPGIAIGWMEKKPVRYIPGIQVRWRDPDEKKEWFLKARGISRTPSLNDLYWYPGGNPELKEELGNKFSGGHLRSIIKPGFKLDLEATAFHQHIRNWIVWQPGIQSHIWSPVNLREVLSYGLDFRFLILFQQASGNWKLRGGYGWNRVRERDVNGILEKRQLIYTPQHSANLYGSYHWKHWRIENSWHYTGKRLSGKGLGQQLPDQLLADLSLAYDALIRKQSIRLEAQLRNLANIQYESIAGYPMPGRSLDINLIIKLQKHKTNKTNETP